MKNCLSIACVAQWVEHMNKAELFFKRCVDSSNPVRDIFYCEDFCFYFLLKRLLHGMGN